MKKKSKGAAHHFSVYVKSPRDQERIRAAARKAGQRAKVRISLSAWLESVVLEAVSREEETNA